MRSALLGLVIVLLEFSCDKDICLDDTIIIISS